MAQDHLVRLLKHNKNDTMGLVSRQSQRLVLVQASKMWALSRKRDFDPSIFLTAKACASKAFDRHMFEVSPLKIIPLRR